MTKNPRLDEAVAIFKELGWADATYADALTLPLGTDAQRKVALTGLRSGDWVRAEIENLLGVEPDTFRSGELPDLTLMLWLFAVRVGVDAKRAAMCTGIFSSADVLHHAWFHHRDSGMPDAADAAVAVLAARGPTFAQTFVQRVCTSENRWGGEYAGSTQLRV
ncbi:MAG: hypothetical protein FWH11_12060 [Micrococcales bacterium]|nr:hypothetical protein [Micrococcales bacterium]